MRPHRLARSNQPDSARVVPIACKGVLIPLTMQAANPLPDNTQLTSGTFKPNQGTLTLTGGAKDAPVPFSFPFPAPTGPYGTALSVFDGTNPNGTWKLFYFDDSSDDVGQFDLGWSLEITTSDTTAPKVMSTSPATIAPTANVTATFTEAMDAQRNRRGSEHDHRHDLQAGQDQRRWAPQPGSRPPLDT